MIIRTTRNRVSLWRFDTKYHFWSRISRRMARSLESIVLEESVLAKSQQFAVLPGAV